MSRRWRGRRGKKLRGETARMKNQSNTALSTEACMKQYEQTLNYELNGQVEMLGEQSMVVIERPLSIFFSCVCIK